jgi:hypothetical protein
MMDLRRAYWINKSFQHTTEKLMRFYATTGLKGTFSNNDPLFIPMPIGWKGEHSRWRHTTKPRGPIALLIQRLLECNSYIDKIFTVWSPHEPNFNLLQSPLHLIKRFCYIICEASAFEALGAMRKVFATQTNRRPNRHTPHHQ